MEPEGSLQCSQQPSNDDNPKSINNSWRINAGNTYIN
jgi:hypothetical protein